MILSKGLSNNKKFKRLIYLSLVCVVITGSTIADGTQVGDDGHFLLYVPKVYFQNPDGRDFSITITLIRMPIDAWNPKEVNLRISDPSGKAILDGAKLLVPERRLGDECFSLRGQRARELWGDLDLDKGRPQEERINL